MILLQRQRKKRGDDILQPVLELVEKYARRKKRRKNPF